MYKEISYETSIVSVTNQSGQITEVNDRFCKVSGYKREELLGQNHRVVSSGFHDKAFFKEMWDSLLSGNEWRGQICNRTKDGTFYWVNTVIKPIWIEQKSEYEFVSTRTLITNKKRSQQVLERLQEVANIGYWDYWVKEDKLDWSSQIYKIQELDSKSHIPSMSESLERAAPGQRRFLIQEFRRCIKEGQSFDVEIELFLESDRVIWVRIVGQPEVYKGLTRRFFGTFQDITERKEAEIGLKKSRYQLDMALTSAGIGTWYYYPKEDRLLWDDKSLELFGVKRENFPGSAESWLNSLTPQSRDRANQEFQRCLEQKEKVYNSEFQVLLPSGKLREMKGRAFIEYDSEGHPEEIIGLNWDISKEKEFQNTLVAAREKALDATRAKSSFLASMSHEIRTPMNGLMGMLELLNETKLEKSQRDLLDTMESCGQQLLHIVNDILDFSKIEAGKMTFEYHSFNLKKLFSGIVAIFEASAQKKGIELSFDIAPDTPLSIMGDETRLKQILTNLVSNALKFTEEGSVTFKVQLDKKRSGKNHGTLLFTVIDTGIGIPLDKQKNLFNSFSQLDDSTTRKFGGTGLGLAICQSFVEKMGGHIGVESDEGAGSIFFFEIMAGLVPEHEVLEIKEDFGTNYRRDLNILLAEDNATNQHLVISFLKKLGLSCDVAQNGQEACKKTSLGDYDLIFMDVQMPMMDGLEATKVIKSSMEDRAPKIIAMTANAFEDDKEKCFKAGMDDFLSKPIKKKNLVNMLSKYFSGESDVNQESAPLVDHRSVENQMSSKIVDIEKVIYEFGEDFDIFEELIEDYKVKYPEMLEAILLNVKNNNNEGVKVNGHTLKGIVSNFYSPELKSLAFKIESCGERGELSSVPEIVSRFKKYNDAVLSELQKFIQKHQEKLGKAS